MMQFIKDSNGIIALGDKEYELNIDVDGNWICFDGHFDEFKIFAGVAQLALVLEMAAICLKTDKVAIKKIPVIKYTMPIVPLDKLKIHLNFIDDKTFNMEIFKLKQGEFVSASNAKVVLW